MNPDETLSVLRDDSDIDLSSTSKYSNSTNENENDMLSSCLLNGIFFNYLPKKSSNKQIVGLCVKCLPKKTEIKGHNRSTSNFVSHLKRKHGSEVFEEYQQCAKNCKVTKSAKRQKYKKSDSAIASIASNEQNKPTAHALTQKDFEANLTNFFIHSMIPLRTIEDPYFSKLMADFDEEKKGFKIPNRRSLRKIIFAQFFEQITEIIEKLKLVKYICLTTDIWSGKKRSYLGVTAHFINDNLKRESVALACRRFKGAHTFDRIAELLLEVCEDFQMNSGKVVATVTDNGSNFVKAFNVFGVKTTSLSEFDKENEVLFISEASDSEDEIMFTERAQYLNTEQQDDNGGIILSVHLRCCSHTLNLIASSDIQFLLNDQTSALGKMHLEVMKKCNELWNLAGRPKSAECIQNVLGHTLSRPGLTRWNSLYDSLKQILSIKSRSNQLGQELQIKNPLRTTEFEYIEEYLQCAAPIADVLDILQGDDTFYGIVLPCLLALRKKLQKLSRQELQYCRPIVNTYLKKLEERFSEFYNVSSTNAEKAVVAALTHPKFKNKWYVCLQPIQHKKCTRLLELALRQEISQNSLDTETAHQNEETIKSRQDDFFDFSSDSGSETDSICPKKRADLIVKNYFAEESREIELLHRYPLLKTVFVKYNTPMPSSGPVERMFSYATMTNSPKSHKLSDEMFEKRVVMKNNLNIMNRKH